MTAHPQTSAADAEPSKGVTDCSRVESEAPATSAPEKPSDDIEKAEPADEKPAICTAGSEGGDAADPDAETAELLKGWRVSISEPSLCELNGSVKMPGMDSKWCVLATPLCAPSSVCTNDIRNS